MPRGHGLTPDDVQRIRDGHAAGESASAIARDLNRAPSTIARHARAMGIPFDGSKTAAATEQSAESNRKKRAELETRLLDEAGLLLDQLHGPHLVYNFGGKDNTYEERTLAEPDVASKATLVKAASTAIDRAVKLAEADKASTGALAGKSMVGSLFAALAVTPADTDPEPDDSETTE